MIETGRDNQTPHNDSVSPVCNSGIIEDEFNFVCCLRAKRKERDFSELFQGLYHLIFFLELRESFTAMRYTSTRYLSLGILSV